MKQIYGNSLLETNLMILILQVDNQKPIQNPVKHLRWKLLSC